VPSSRLIKRRIKSAKNISQITKAMEMVSASKMKRAQDQALTSRPYARKLIEMLRTIALHTDPSAHPLLQTHESRKILVVLISTDRGLAGGLQNLFKSSEELIRGQDVSFIVLEKSTRVCHEDIPLLQSSPACRRSYVLKMRFPLQTL
jgi:F-type H+-transporting ATPase subunit gamma